MVRYRRSTTTKIAYTRTRKTPRGGGGGDVEAQYSLCQINDKNEYRAAYFYFPKVSNPKDVIACYSKVAENGNILAQYTIGLAYASISEYKQAAVWLRKAAEGKDTRDHYHIEQSQARNLLAMMNAYGLGVPRDCTQAIDWLKKSGAWTLQNGVYFPWEENKARKLIDFCNRKDEKENRKTYGN